MKKYLYGLMLISTLALWGCKTTNTNGAIKNIDAQTFYSQTNGKNVQLLDVRTVEEYNEGHIPNSVNIDVNTAQFESQLIQFDKNKPLYIYCRSGGRSAKAAEILEKNGFKNIYNLDSGILQWPYELKK